MVGDLSKYEIQLEMVEAALHNDFQNEELLQLKADLKELIALTKDLIKIPDGDSKVSNNHGSSNDHDVVTPFLDTGTEDIGEDNLKVNPDGSSILEVVNTVDVTKIGRCLKRPHSGDENNHRKDHNKEYLKKKRQKKQERFKQYDEERESEKNKWLSFHSRAAKKRGVSTKSIFATPDNLTGRVGVGTCGISGKPMTEYTSGKKWKKSG